MRHWMHDELHTLIDNNSILKAKSNKVHALMQISSEEKKQGKLQMMEIYAETINCKQADVAKEFVEKIFLCMRQGTMLDTLRNEYALQKSCHSPDGNDYMCFCDEVNFHGLTPVALAEYELARPPAAEQLHPTRLRAGHCVGRVKEKWIRCSEKIVEENETGITFTEEGGAIWKHKQGDYRKDGNGNVELRIGSYAEFIQ